MDKIKILLLSVWYPLTMSRYFEKALRSREDVDLKTAGPYTGSWIPWMGGMSLPMKYAVPPDIPIPHVVDISELNYEFPMSQFPEGWKPDIVLTIGTNIKWKYKPHHGKVIHVATDPHVMNDFYDSARSYSDLFYSMQEVYARKGDRYLPYAYSKHDFYPDDSVSKDIDAVLIGMPYDTRVQWKQRLEKLGVSVCLENGPVYDEARALYNRGKIGLNWSTLDDLNCRAFELPAMKICPVMNLVSDIGKFFSQGDDYLGFTNLDEAVERVVWAKEHPLEARQIAEHGYQTVLPHTYDARCEQILKESGFLS